METFETGLERLIDVALGREEADLLLKDCKVVNVFTGEIYEANIAIFHKYVAGVGPTYSKARHILDCKGAYAIPGLIDSHMHLESTLLRPIEFARAVLPHGTTTVVIDPHEIANVCGIKGLSYIAEEARLVPLNIVVMAPSCVPATGLETSGAEIAASHLKGLFDEGLVHGLGEVMNFPGVLNKSKDVLDKLAVAHGFRVMVDGHAPHLGGPQLNAYTAAGIRSDHECTMGAEALEKARLGMSIYIREGSCAKNLEAILPVVTEANLSQFSFASDDRHPDELVEKGHIDHIMRKAVNMGVPPIWAIKMATINAARNLRLERRGAICPGYYADIAMVKDLSGFETIHLIYGGEVVVEDRATKWTPPPPPTPPFALNTVNIGNFNENDLKIDAPNGARANIIGLVEGEILTEWLIDEPCVVDGVVLSDTERDILKVAVIERHKGTGNVGLGLVKGFGLRQGAIASTVSHDSHNIVVVGVTDDDMALAVNHLRSIGGGFTVVKDGRVLADCPLSIGGLMSERPYERVIEEMDNLLDACKAIGTRINSPLMALSFLALPVIPKLRLTDRGLVDVTAFKHIELFGDVDS